MKKILALSVALALMASAVFAQEDASEKKWKFTFTADTVADVFYLNLKTLGDDYLKSGQFFNPSSGNVSGEHPIYQSQFGVFSNIEGAGKWSTFDSNELRLAYNYNGEFVTLYARTNIDGLIDSLLDKSTNAWNNILGSAFDEVKLTGKLGDMFTAEISNTNKRGIFGDLRYYGSYDEFGIPSFTGFGVQTLVPGNALDTGIFFDDSGNPKLDSRDPAYDPAYVDQSGPYVGQGYVPLTVTGYEVNNFRDHFSKDLLTGSQKIGDRIPGFLLTGNFGPVSAQLYGGVVSNGGKLTEATDAKANLGVRVEAAKLADLVDVAAIYKFTAADQTRTGYTWMDEGGMTAITSSGLVSENDPNGDGKSTHAFGIYANITPIENFGIAVGYSGLAVATEDRKYDGDTFKTTDPFWSGVDLKVHFSGIDRLALDFTTNGSFAGAKGDDDAKTTIHGLSGSGNLTGSNEQSALVWTAGLAANFNLTEKLIINGTFGNTLSTYLLKYDTALAGKGETTYTQNVLRFYAGIIYAANPNVTFRGGIALRNTGNLDETKPNSGSSTKKSANTFEFGIPIGLKVTF